MPSRRGSPSHGAHSSQGGSPTLKRRWLLARTRRPINAAMRQLFKKITAEQDSGMLRLEWARGGESRVISVAFRGSERERSDVTGMYCCGRPKCRSPVRLWTASPLPHVRRPLCGWPLTAIAEHLGICRASVYRALQ